jgi:lipopolysaccharide export system permease protein
LRRVDRLIVSEMIGPWVFGVMLFSVLIIAGTYLFRITDYVVQGVAFGTVMELTLLIMPGVMVKTFAMSVLLAALLAFGRLSSDSEIVALRASGVSLARIMFPVAVFSVAVAAVAFFINETLVPNAAKRTFLLQNEIAQTLDAKALRPTSYPIVREGQVVAMVSARDFSPLTRTLRNATIITFDREGNNAYYMEARELEIDPSELVDGAGWRIRGGARLLSADGRQEFTIDGEAWPDQIPRPVATVDDLITAQIRDLDVFSMAQMREQIQKERQKEDTNPAVVANLEYGYWNKFALPLAALIYGLLGAPLGIRNHRTGAATGFALSIGIIFGYVTLANLMNVYAMGGLLPPYVASFTPLVIGLFAAGIIAWRRNG